MSAKARFVLDNFVDSSTLYSYAIDDEVYVTNAEVGAVTNAAAGTSGFTVSTEVDGSTTVAEESKIITTVATSLAGTYFTITSTARTYYVWYEVDGTGPDPAPGGTGLKIELLSTDLAEQVASATKLALAKITDEFVVVDGASSTLPVTNVQNISRAKILRTTDNTDFEIFGAFDGTKSITSLVFGRHNLSLYTRYRIRFYKDSTTLLDSGSSQTLVFDSGTLAITNNEDTYAPLIGWGEFEWGNYPWGFDSAVEPDEFDPPDNYPIWLSDAQNNVRAFKLTLSVDDPITTTLKCNTSYAQCNDGTIQCNQTTVDLDIYPTANVSEFEIGRLFIAKHLEVPYNMSYGHTLEWTEDTKQYRTDAGTLRSDFSVPYRVITFDLNTIPESYRPTLQHGFRKVGLRNDLFVSLFPEDCSEDKRIDYSGIMKLTKTPKFTEFAPNFYKSSYTLEEV